MRLSNLIAMTPENLYLGRTLDLGNKPYGAGGGWIVSVGLSGVRTDPIPKIYLGRGPSARFGLSLSNEDVCN